MAKICVFKTVEVKEGCKPYKTNLDMGTTFCVRLFSKIKNVFWVAFTAWITRYYELHVKNQTQFV